MFAMSLSLVIFSLADLYDEGCALIESLELEYKLRGYSLLEEAAENGNKLAKEKLSYGYMVRISTSMNVELSKCKF